MELAPAVPGIGKAINCAWYRLALPPEQPAEDWTQAIDHLVGSDSPLCYKRPKDGKLFDVRSAVAACRIQLPDTGIQESCTPHSLDQGCAPHSVWAGRSPDAEDAEEDPRTSNIELDLLVELGETGVPLRGIVETLLPLAGASGCYEPSRVTRMALLRWGTYPVAPCPPDMAPTPGHPSGGWVGWARSDGLVNPLGERKQLWET
jgi:hypothetical protein